MSLDLVVLVPDDDIRHTLAGILSRDASLGIRRVRHEEVVHPRRDPGCFHEAERVLRPYSGDAKHALVIFDLAWEGVPSDDRREVASRVEQSLHPSWQDRARCIVIAPEVEQWIWTPSPHVARALGWGDRFERLRAWLERERLWPQEQAKPPDPKEAYRRALRKTSTRPSAAIFKEIARHTSLSRCKDPSFQDLVNTLRRWFPRGHGR